MGGFCVPIPLIFSTVTVSEHKTRFAISHLVNAISSFKIVHKQQCRNLSMSRDTDYLVVVFFVHLNRFLEFVTMLYDLHLQFFRIISKYYLRKTQHLVLHHGWTPSENFTLSRMLQMAFMRLLTNILIC